MLSVVFFSALNDVLMRLGGERLPDFQVVFMRFAFTLITLVPFVLRQHKDINTNQFGLHASRALICTAAIICSYFSVKHLPLSVVTTLFFIQPLFFLPLAKVVLAEHIGSARVLATVIGFVGVFITGFNPDTQTWAFNPYMLYPLSGALLYATVDVITKRMVNQEESTLAMLFYFALVSTVATAAFALPWWQAPTLNEWLTMAVLGVSANLIQVGLLKAFAATEASLLSPFKYTEIIFSATFGVVFFAEWPTLYVLLGALFITLSNYYVTRHDPYAHD